MVAEEKIFRAEFLFSIIHNLAIDSKSAPKFLLKNDEIISPKK
jgi:hypothetical protein